MTMHWDILSKHRGELMGISIIFIMLFHSLLSTQTPSLKALVQMGNIGVEFFLFLSAFGLYYSQKRNPVSIIQFYKKRVKRILPAYLLVALFVYAFIIHQEGEWSIVTYLLNVMQFNFFIQGNTEFWFIPLLMVCYLLTPFYFKLIEGRKTLSFLLPILICAACYFLFQIPQLAHLEIAGDRLATFFLGFACAQLSCTHQTIRASKTTQTVVGISAIAFLYASRYFPCYISIERVVGFAVTIPLLLLLSLMLENTRTRVKAILVYLGTLSLELYLVHENIGMNLSIHIPYEAIRPLCSYVIAIVGALLLHTFVSRKKNC